MLVQFSVGNYKTFKDTATLSMVASNYFKELPENVVEVKAGSGKLRLLKSVAIYGANASGKSKLLDAMNFMQAFVRNSASKSQEGDPIQVEAFRLNEGTKDEASLFEVIFLLHTIQYRYGFMADTQRVHSEWLYRKAVKVEVEVLSRTFQEVNVHSEYLKKGNLLKKENLVRENALFLSVAAQLNDALALELLEWFAHFQGISGVSDAKHMGFTMRQMENEAQRQKILSLLDNADIGIKDIALKKEDVSLDKMPKELNLLPTQKVNVQTLRVLYDENNMPTESQISFDIGKEESAGTRKYFALLGPMLHSCEKNNVLFVDELDAKLHPNLVKKIIAFFHQETTNPCHSQLIFNTHNTHLLSSDLFRRDQIWFTEKDRYGAASLYSLAEFKGEGKTPRKDNNHENQYLAGSYGGVPYLKDFDILDSVETVAP